jgi:hypothetical protein
LGIILPTGTTITAETAARIYSATYCIFILSLPPSQSDCTLWLVPAPRDHTGRASHPRRAKTVVELGTSFVRHFDEPYLGLEHSNSGTAQ